MKRTSGKRRAQPGAVILALGLIVIGGWLITGDLLPLNRSLVQPVRLWPLVVALPGLAFLAQYIFEKPRPGGLLFLGVLALLSGAFLCAFSFRIGRLDWPDMARYWPVFPLILGAAFMALYLAGGMREQALLIPAFISGGAGLFSLPFTLGVMRGTVLRQVLQFWPLLLLLVGLMLLLGPRSQEPGGA